MQFQLSAMHSLFSQAETPYFILSIDPRGLLYRDNSCYETCWRVTALYDCSSLVIVSNAHYVSTRCFLGMSDFLLGWDFVKGEPDIRDFYVLLDCTVALLILTKWRNAQGTCIRSCSWQCLDFYQLLSLFLEPLARSGKKSSYIHKP